MFEGRRVLVVVPARGGSKGVKLKNLREVGGVPLVALAGRIAAALPWADRRIVSTDHGEIARVAKASGLAVPFLRPEEISGAIIGDWQVLIHALTEMERIDAVSYDIVVMLQPTSPSRRPEHVTRTVAHLVQGNYDSVWTVSESDPKGHPLKQLVLSDKGDVSYYDPNGARIVARQQLTPLYTRNGIAYAMTRECLVEQKTTAGARWGAVLIKGELANIDTELDLLWANFLLAHQDLAGIE
ncbi:MAG: acylneuraminate cytidylyltransferase family protein [Rhizobiales bacterium]|nr:acylneuraminate cytidylyltransferase family protein [Hyphomicrobiales bacterium]MBI3672214.1 acylneuraminate cytidylyltransferase family protein [Hyphomicrobiales bacterium]